MLIGLLLILLTAGPSSYVLVTSRSKKRIPCTRCKGEGYTHLRNGLYRRCPKCGGAKSKLKYAAARRRHRRLRTARA